jgi:hypothetical protein
MRTSLPGLLGVTMTLPALASRERNIRRVEATIR